MADDLGYLDSKITRPEAFGKGGKGHNRLDDCPHPKLVYINPSHARLTYLRRFRKSFQFALGDPSGVDAPQDAGKTIDHLRQTTDDLRPFFQHFTAMQVFGVVSDRFDAKYAGAFGITLQRQPLEVNLENSHVIHRSLDHNFEARRLLPNLPVRAMLAPKRVRMIGMSNGLRVRSIIT